mmetsp:Transcript_8267/g.36566  ORF Transcript_8267/g.36566 Transcript_8267/m.36566 type:complete len:234 (+) Transcript_8267:394-1095(+)
MFMWYVSRWIFTLGSSTSFTNAIACSAVLIKLVSYRLTTSKPSTTLLVSAAFLASLLIAATALARPVEVHPRGYLPSALYRMPHMCVAPMRTETSSASSSNAFPLATMDASSLDTSASKERPKDVATPRPCVASAFFVIATSTDDGFSKGISMTSYPAAAVLAHASSASAADQPPVQTRACTPRGDDARAGDDSPDEVAADEIAADEIAPPRAWALVGTDARWTAVDVARWTG